VNMENVRSPLLFGYCSSHYLSVIVSADFVTLVTDCESFVSFTSHTFAILQFTCLWLNYSLGFEFLFSVDHIVKDSMAIAKIYK
jgi:hypothetical protein